MISQHRLYTGRVKFQRDKTTVKPEAEALEGQFIVVEALWLIEEGPFEGQWHMGITDYHRYRLAPNIFWMPSGDLVDLKEIPLEE